MTEISSDGMPSDRAIRDEDTPQPGQDQADDVCPYCHGSGYVRLDVPVGHPKFGKAVPCVCRRKQIQQKRLQRLREAGNLKHLKGMTFESFQTERHDAREVFLSLRDALEMARSYARDPRGWLMFKGPYGCGKTHLAAAIANDRIERQHPALFVVVPDLLDFLRASYAPDSPVTYNSRFEQIRSVELLILDDLGTQNATPWAAEKLYQIINYRYNAELPTVITTNQPLGDMDPRLASRLKDESLVSTIPIYAPNFRIKSKDESFGSMNLYNDMTFKEFSMRQHELNPGEQKVLQYAIQMAKEFAERPQSWLLFRGDYGVGKTHLAAAVANRVARQGMAVKFVVVADLLDYLRATFDRGSATSYDQRFNEVRHAWLLVLDDVGAQNSTSWVQEKLFQILNYRYVGRLPTILTVSDTSWEELHPRLKSRLQDTSVCSIIDLDIPSYRGGNDKKPRYTTRKRLP